MPSDWSRVPHYKQSQEGLCLPACVRMVLAHLGRDMDEARLAQALKTRPFGTPADNIRFLGKLGYTVLFERGTESDLRRWLGQSLPCIVFQDRGFTLLENRTRARRRPRWPFG